MADIGGIIKEWVQRLFKVNLFSNVHSELDIVYKLNCVGPVARFGDTAANAGILALLQSNSYLKDLPSPIKTIFVSLWYAAKFPSFCELLGNTNGTKVLRDFE
jgi:hypothetical protein